LFGTLALLLAGLSGYFWYQADQAKDALAVAEVKLEDCTTASNSSSEAVALIEDLQRADNQVVSISATNKYQTTSIFIYNNPATQRNYLALGDLPEIGPDQAFQLWSLKEGVDPIPLTVFDASEMIVPVSFEDGTATYAITIEAKGGAQVPNLDQLIGNFNMAG